MTTDNPFRTWRYMSKRQKITAVFIVIFGFIISIYLIKMFNPPIGTMVVN